MTESGRHGDDSLWARADSVTWTPQRGEPSDQPTSLPSTPHPSHTAPQSLAPFPERGDTPGSSQARGFVAGRQRAFVLSVAAVLAIGLIVVIGVAMFGGDDGLGGQVAHSPADSRSELAKLCPAPQNAPSPGPVEPAPPGPRLNDTQAGISYSAVADPFRNWDRGVWDDGELGVEFLSGYYLVTEEYSSGEYLASVLSGSVPATVGDSLTLNLECAGQQVAEDVRRAYYPQPNEKEELRNEYTRLGGLPAWVSIFHVTFSARGLEATGEWVAVVTVMLAVPPLACCIFRCLIPINNFALDSRRSSPRFGPLTECADDSTFLDRLRSLACLSQQRRPCQAPTIASSVLR